MGIHKGQKLTDNPKDMEFKFRYDAEIKDKLDFISKRSGKKKSAVVRDAIRLLYAEARKE